MYIVDVAQIIARRSTENYLVDCIRKIAPSLSDFEKDNPLNLICLCPTHHREFDSEGFVFVPGERQRNSMLEYEERDFAMREESIAQGRGVGRSRRWLLNEFEYIPVTPSPFRVQVYNPTPHDPYTFVFDNEEQRPCPLLHFQASHVALMVQGIFCSSHFPRVVRTIFVRDMAGPQITSLLMLYERQPRLYSTPVPNDQFYGGPMPGLTPNSSASTQTEVADANLYAGVDLQLLGYAKQPSITGRPEDQATVVGR